MLLGESYLPVLHISKVLIKLTCPIRYSASGISPGEQLPAVVCWVLLEKSDAVVLLRWGLITT